MSHPELTSGYRRLSTARRVLRYLQQSHWTGGNKSRATDASCLSDVCVLLKVLLWYEEVAAEP